MTDSTLTSTQRSILYAIDCYTNPSEAQVLSFLGARSRTKNITEDMDALIKHAIVERITPAPMSGKLPSYRFVAINGATNLKRAIAEDQAYVGCDLTPAQEVVLRAIRGAGGKNGADDFDKLHERVKGQRMSSFCRSIL